MRWIIARTMASRAFASQPSIEARRSCSCRSVLGRCRGVGCRPARGRAGGGDDRVIATSGVSCSHSEIVEAARPYNALIAFDADHRINPAVCRQLARLIVQRHKDSREQGLSVSTKILFWNGPKGIDDAVRTKMKLSALTVSEWYNTLEYEPLEEVNRFWKEEGGFQVLRNGLTRGTAVS